MLRTTHVIGNGRHKTPKRSVRQGATAVEFALVVPIVFLVLFSAFDLLSAFSVYSAADQGLYLAVRKGTLPGAGDQQLLEEIEAEVQRLNLEIEKMDIGVNQFENADFVEVAVSIPLEKTSWLAPMFIRDKAINMKYSRPRERFPRGTELNSAFKIPPPSKPGFNVSRQR